MINHSYIYSIYITVIVVHANDNSLQALYSHSSTKNCGMKLINTATVSSWNLAISLLPNDFFSTILSNYYFNEK